MARSCAALIQHGPDRNAPPKKAKKKKKKTKKKKKKKKRKSKKQKSKNSKKAVRRGLFQYGMPHNGHGAVSFLINNLQCTCFCADKLVARRARVNECRIVVHWTGLWRSVVGAV